jgi:signal transduction histidine kinase
MKIPFIREKTGDRPRVETDERVKRKHFSWLDYAIAFGILLVLSGGQALIYSAYISVEPVPLEYIFGMVGYWALVSAGFCLITIRQKIKLYDKPMRAMSKAAKNVACGDFAVQLEPFHKPEKHDYVDVMFEDFNKMVVELNSIETLKTDFIGNVSHEIKTPLSVIQSYAMALQKDDLVPETRREYSNTIITASQRLTTLVTNILKLSKLENQEIAPDAREFDLCRQLADCALTFESVWEGKNIEFEVDMDDRATIFADESMLEIVWHNLLSNALKFTEPGGKITLTQTSEEDSVTVSVADTGCGMSDKTIAHIFDKFYQGDTSHSGEGNGLGLALAFRVVEIFGGSISATSEPGQGSTFTVRLQTEP